ncbi:hypothetical protein C8R45DRAFT_1186305 [Mycena sanguinolenta]|nr:hypothetical protein C8R45DRAFT_1186305 [Mycena sanguinolenta]
MSPASSLSGPTSAHLHCVSPSGPKSPTLATAPETTTAHPAQMQSLLLAQTMQETLFRAAETKEALVFVMAKDQKARNARLKRDNSLLSTLTREPGLHALIPRVCHLVLRRSRLQFNDNVFLRFLLSRVSYRQCDSVPGFEVNAFRLRGCRRNLEPGVLTEIRELCWPHSLR